MYSQSITHIHRTAFIIAVDCSLSMMGLTRLNGRVMCKADAVAVICNFIIDELIERCTRLDEIRNYFDIAVVGYNYDDIIPIIPKQADKLIAIDQLAATAPEIKRRALGDAKDNNGIEAEQMLREWVSPIAEGPTPMHTALTYIYTLLDKWSSRPENRESFPPIVFNITDGKANDATPAELISIARDITSTGTNQGNTLLINIELGNSDNGKGVIFPADNDTNFEFTSQYQMTLFQMSSLMPESMEQIIREVTTASAEAPYRGIALNVTPSELFNILNIGTESIKVS